MTTVTRACAKCGAKIFPEAPQEFCSACFLKTGLNLLTDEPVALVDGGSARRGETINPFGLLAEASAQAGERVPPEKEDARPGKMLGDLGDWYEFNGREATARLSNSCPQDSSRFTSFPSV